MTIREWIHHVIPASFRQVEQPEVFEAASAYLDWIESLPVLLCDIGRSG